MPTAEEVYSRLHPELQSIVSKILSTTKDQRKIIKHTFSDTALEKYLYFNIRIENQTLEKYLILFEGGYGHGYYHEIRYNIPMAVYEYCIQKEYRDKRIVFFSDSWQHLCEKLKAKFILH